MTDASIMHHKNEKKRKGRPPHVDRDGKTEISNIRFAVEMKRKINEWRRKEPDIPGFSEAVRRLLEKALDP